MAKGKVSKWAIVNLILSVLYCFSFLFLFFNISVPPILFYGAFILMPILSIVSGIVALVEIKKKNKRGKILAIVGLIITGVTIIVIVALVIQGILSGLGQL